MFAGAVVGRGRGIASASIGLGSILLRAELKNLNGRAAFGALLGSSKPARAPTNYADVDNGVHVHLPEIEV